MRARGEDAGPPRREDQEGRAELDREEHAHERVWNHPGIWWANHAVHGGSGCVS